MTIPRRDKGIPQLTARDRHVLNWIGEQYAVRLDTLRKLLGRMPGKSSNEPHEEGTIATRNVYRIIKRWETFGVAEYQKFWDDTPGWVWLTPIGLRFGALEYAPWSPRQGTQFEHLHLINELRFRLEERYGGLLAWESERRLRKEAGELSQSERIKLQLPDAAIVLEGNRIGIQVEISVKSNRRVERIVRNLVDQYDAIWYFVTDSAEPVIRRASRSTNKLKVYPLRDVLA